MYGNSNYGYGGYGYPSMGLGIGYAPTVTTGIATPVTLASAYAPTTATVTNGTATAATNFADQGEAAFKAGDYKGAAYALQHAVVDNQQNPVLMLMHAQALFATGKFEQAAGATQAAMSQLDKDKWGVVVKNYRELYGNASDYTSQLRSLEAAIKDKRSDPALRFLLGYHYAYLGFPQQAAEQLNQAVTLAPQDEMAKQLLGEMQAKLPKPAAGAEVPVIPPAPAAVAPPGAAIPARNIGVVKDAYVTWVQ